MATEVTPEMIAEWLADAAAPGADPSSMPRTIAVARFHIARWSSDAANPWTSRLWRDVANARALCTAELVARYEVAS